MVFSGLRRRKVAALLLVIFSGVAYASQQGQGPAPAELSGLSILFKLDVLGGTYGGERWLSGPTFTSLVQPGTVGKVDVKVRGIDARGKLVDVVPEWTAAVPERITVTPRQKEEFRITVSGPGESRLTVAAQGASQELLVRAIDLGSATRVEISRGAASGSPGHDAPAAAPGDANAAGDVSLLTDQKAKKSYAMGLAMGKRLKDMSLELDADLVARAVMDALSGDSSLLSEGEMKAALAALRVDFREKQREAQKQLAEKNKKAGEAFLDENAKQEGVVTLPSGLQYKVLEAGEGGTPTDDDVVKCRYRLTDIDGKVLESSGGRPKTLSMKRLIPGWREALKLMPVGSKWQLFVPSELAYGERGRGRRIGPNTTLVFEVALVSFEDKAGTHEPAFAQTSEAETSER